MKQLIKDYFRNPIKILGIIVLEIMLSTSFISETQAQLTPTTWDFAANSTGWTGNFTRSTLTNASMCGTAAMRKNLYSSVTTGNLVTPVLPGTNNAGLVTISYKYKTANYSSPNAAANPWGSFNVQYGSTATGPWTTFATVSQETQTGSCLTKTHTFTPPVGSVYIKFDCFWTAGDYYLAFDDVQVVSQGAAPSCSAPTAFTHSNLTTSSVNLSWIPNIQNPSNSFKVELRTSGAPGSGSVGLINAIETSGNNILLNSLAQNTNYNAYLQSICNVGDTSAWLYSSFLTGYCTSSSTSSSNGYISGFSTSGSYQDINNSSSGASTGGYSDYTSQSLSVSSGEIVNFSASINSSSGFKIWIDFNNDLDFLDTGEQVYSSSSYVTSINSTFTIPSEVAQGAYRLRIRSDWNTANPSPCGNISSGETEDYLINIIPMNGCTNTNACNYNPLAQIDNNSCRFIGMPCNDLIDSTFNDAVNDQCICQGTLIVLGCTNLQACNYNPAANQDNGTCLVLGNSCNDNQANTINDVVNDSCICTGTPTDLNGNNENTYQGLYYQAVARNADGTPMANQNVSIRFSLHQSTATGAIEYQEVQNVNSNALGLFTTYFGSGQATVGNFNNIQWGVNAKYLQVEMYTTNWQTIGTQQLAAVPYAIRAKQVEPDGLKLQSPNGNCYILQVNNAGQLSTIAVPCD